MATLTDLKTNKLKIKTQPTFNAIIINNINDKLSQSALLGKKLIDWVSFACEDIPHKVIECEGKVNLLEFISGKDRGNFDYTIVLLSNTPLLTSATIKDIITYATMKNISLCKLPVGYVLQNKEFASGVMIDSVYSNNIDEFYLVENKKQLNHAIDILQDRINNFHMQNGVELKKPKSVYIEPMVDIAEGVVIYPNNSIKGASVIGEGVILKENNVIENSKIGKNSCISGSNLTKSIIEENVYIASFCEINNSFVGKDTIIESGSKISNYNIKSLEKIKANSVLGETNDSSCGTGKSGQKL